MRFLLPPDVTWILEKLENAGFRADIVGGPVRDLIRGVEPFDYDITTSALPEETCRVFSGEKIIETGIKHGTVALLKNGQQYEITTYRVDGEYEDSRHPKSVSFTPFIEDDLARRDFTVNAIAYSPKYGITDPFFGERDIEDRIIRAVGVAEERFDEDALRIIRGIRFASTLGFEIEEKTKRAMISRAHLLGRISSERIFTEWKKLLSGDGALEILEEFSSVTRVFFPEIAIPESIDKKAFSKASTIAKHVSLFAARGAEKYLGAMSRLKTDRVTAQAGAAVISAIGKYKREDSSLAFMLRDLGEERAKLLLECEAILGIGSLCDLARLEAVKNSGVPYTLAMLEVGGEDLLALGISGKEIGSTLGMLLEKVIKGELQNEKATLISSIKES